MARLTALGGLELRRRGGTHALAEAREREIAQLGVGGERADHERERADEGRNAIVQQRRAAPREGPRRRHEATQAARRAEREEREEREAGEEAAGAGGELAEHVCDGGRTEAALGSSLGAFTCLLYTSPSPRD